MSAATWASLLGGLAVLVLGGELLVRGATGLARAVGMSSLIVGLTVVSFATSAPELAVTLQAALTGNASLAVGNVVGSNVANILLVIGISAVILPLAAKSQLVKLDVPVMVTMSVAVLLLALDGSISRTDGLILVAALLIYLAAMVVTARHGRAERPVRPAATVDDKRRPVWMDALLILAGVGLLVFGAQLLVNGATDVAEWLGLSELIVGLTIVAVGTSLPEIATSIIAAVRGERDLAIGNAVGSNIFNIGSVLGVTGILANDGVAVADSAVRFDIPIMIAVALVLLPIAFTRFTIARWEGALLIAFYGAYVLYLLLEATDQPALEHFSAAMLWFVIPLTVLWLLLLVAYEIGLRQARHEHTDEVDQAHGSPDDTNA